MLEFHTEAPQTTASEGLAQGPYVSARAGFEPATNLPMSHHAHTLRKYKQVTFVKTSEKSIFTQYPFWKYSKVLY